MDQKKKNLILAVFALALILGAVLLGFRDSIFSGGDSTTPEVRAAVEDAAKNAPPMPAEPPKSNFTKRAKAVGGQ